LTFLRFSSTIKDGELTHQEMGEKKQMEAKQTKQVLVTNGNASRKNERKTDR